MTITVKDVTVKVDLNDKRDQEVQLEVTGDSYANVKKQIKAFGRDLKDDLKGRKYSAQFGKDTDFIELDEVFRDQKPQ